MGIMSKRIPAFEANITSDGRNHGDTQVLLELDSNSLIIREVKPLHTKVIGEINLSSAETDLFLSSEYGQTSGASQAVTGAVLFGAAGAVAGGMLGKGKDFWIFEVKEADRVRIFKLQNANDKKVLEKYLNKHK